MKKKIYVAFVTVEDYDGKNNPIDDIVQKAFTDYKKLKRWVSRQSKKFENEYGEDATIYWDFTECEIEL